MTAVTEVDPDTLPEPVSSRWTPLRLGLVDMFHYGTEEFAFHHGRLLLRGNNGTGKSKVLALTLPYLLDGDASPQRVEPDRDPDKRMEWNLLLGGKYDERLGYSWIEFGRRTADGGHAYTTLMCGMKAAQGRGIASKWFAISTGRMGEDLHLVDRSGLALSRGRLRDLLGTEGRVVDTVEQWRLTVDEALFGLGSERYQAMLSLLIQLRQPQLSRRPDEQALNDALTEALPPLDQAVIAAVADAMRSLEEEREALRALHETQATLERFAGRYRRYARTALHRRESAVRRRQSEWEKKSVELRDAREELAATQQKVADLQQTLGTAEATTQQLEVRRRAIETSQAMQDAVRLHDARQAAERASRVAQRAAGEVLAAEERARGRGLALAQAEAAMSDAAARVNAGVSRLMAQGEGLGLGADLTQAVLPLRSWIQAGRGDAQLEQAPPDLDLAEQQAAQAITRRRDAVLQVRRLAEDAVAARHVASGIEADRDRSRDTWNQAESAVDTAQQDRTETGDAHLAAVQDWVAGLAELTVPAPLAVLEALQEWIEVPEGVDPASTATRQAGHVAVEALAATRAEVLQRRTSVTEERALAVTEHDQLLAGVDPKPEPFPTRNMASRSHRPGAPLWQLVDFADDVDQGRHAGIEAALEGAGLLDAWILPDGSLLDPSWHDVGIGLSSPGGLPADGQSLASVLVGVVGQAVGADVVARLLSGIGWGVSTADSWISANGRFRIGTLEGAWSKPNAVHIGAAARQAARKARILELAEAISSLDHSLVALDAEVSGLTSRRARLDQEVAALPDAAPVRRAADRLTTAEQTRDQAARELAEQDVRLEQAVASARVVEEDRNATAVQLGLPIGVSELDGIIGGVDSLVVTLGSAVWPAARESVRAAVTVGVETGQVANARQDLADQQTHAERTAAEHTDLDTTASQLASLVGSSVQEAQEELARVDGKIAAAREEEKSLAKEVRQRDQAAGRLEGRIDGLESTIDERRQDRDAAVESLRRAVEVGVLEAALPGVDPPASWAANPAVLFARQITTELDGVESDDDAWRSVQGAVTRHITDLQTDMSVHGGKAEQTLRDDLLVITVTYWGRSGTVQELGSVLATDVAEREMLLSAQEREMIENHLVDEAGAQLGSRILSAEAQVSEMNDQLEKCATSTGMVLRLRWVPSPAAPAALRQAMPVLRQTHQVWGPEQRQTLGELLQVEIGRAREADEHGTWAAHLAQALDYRQWFTFVVERGGPDGWRRAAGPASGGERVLTATLPLFAAAASHYSSGRAESPRLVLLDEAFAGVDDLARRDCMALLTAFDLDCVMTSEREWGCYPEVPGLSICHLIRREGIDAILVSRWRWDGASRTEDPAPIDSARQRAAVASERDYDTLFT